MAAIVIPQTFGEGGAHLNKGAGDPSLRDILVQLAAAVNTGGGATSITAPALPAFTDPPTASEMNSLRVLVNQIRAAIVGP